MDNFTVQAPVVVQRTDTSTTLSTISQTINLPTMDLEPLDSTHSKHQHPEQEVVKSPTEQVQDVMNKELVHLSTCARDHTAPNYDQSLLDLHIDVKAQSDVSIATITMEQQPDLFDCEPPVTMQCSPILLVSTVYIFRFQNGVYLAIYTCLFRWCYGHFYNRLTQFIVYCSYVVCTILLRRPVDLSTHWTVTAISLHGTTFVGVCHE